MKYVFIGLVIAIIVVHGMWVSQIQKELHSCQEKLYKEYMKSGPLLDGMTR